MTRTKALVVAALVASFAAGAVVGLLAGRNRSFWSVSEYAVADRGLGQAVSPFPGRTVRRGRLNVKVGEIPNSDVV